MTMEMSFYRCKELVIPFVFFVQLERNLYRLKIPIVWELLSHGTYYRISIALPNRSFNPSLISQLIPPTKLYSYR